MGWSILGMEDVFKDTHVPFGIKIPNMKENFEIKRAVSKIDIKPTILDLLGLKDGFSLGDSIFSEKDFSFVKGLGFVTSNYYCVNDKFYDRNTLLEIEQTQFLQALQQKMQDDIYLSDAIIKNNLLM